MGTWWSGVGGSGKLLEAFLLVQPRSFGVFRVATCLEKGLNSGQGSLGMNGVGGAWLRAWGRHGK